MHSTISSSLHTGAGGATGATGAAVDEDLAAALVMTIVGWPLAMMVWPAASVAALAARRSVNFIVASASLRPTR